MTGSQLFLLSWASGAVCVGSIFARRPDILLRVSRWRVADVYSVGWAVRRFLPKRNAVAFYRAAGAILLVLGVVVGALALVDVAGLA